MTPGGRKVAVDQLVGSAEVARRLGLRRVQHVHWYRANDPTFPEPVARIGGPKAGIFIWYWPDVRRWDRRGDTQLPDSSDG